MQVFAKFSRYIYYFNSSFIFYYKLKEVAGIFLLFYKILLLIVEYFSKLGTDPSFGCN
jgi:hypothetical protein